MAEQLKVRAVAGTLCPYEPPKAGYVGYERAQSADDADHVVPGGFSYRLLSEAQTVPNTVYYRRALRRGDIENAEELD